MKDEVFEFFDSKGFPFTTLVRKNRGIKPSHIKAAMVDVYNDRHKYKDYQLGRAILRASTTIDNREEYENELKLNQAVKDNIELKERNKTLKTLLIALFLLWGYVVSVGAFLAYPYLERLK